MNQQILRYLKGYSYDTWDINRLLVSSFLRCNGIEYVQNTFINGYIITVNDTSEYNELNNFIKLFEQQNYGIEELIEFFEFVISPKDKEVNGAVYTPEYVRKYIVINSTLKRSTQGDKELDYFLFCDVACGCGGFFKTITETLKERTARSYFQIFSENIFGLDIQEYSVIRTKILLTLLAIINHEDRSEFVFNLYCGDALEFDWKISAPVQNNLGFDVIVGNPPYVGVTKMTADTRALMKNWEVSLSGKPDLYIPFFEIGLRNLNDKGVLGYITVNTFFKSLNGRLLRSYFSKSKFDLTILDFGGEQIFKNRSTYTCICIIGKQPTETIKYLKIDSKNLSVEEYSIFHEIHYNSVNDFDGWHLTETNHGAIIRQIENTGTPLGDRFTIRNGFATLQNQVYVFNPIRESDNEYFFIKGEKEYKIEKGICRNAIKPNTLKNEEQLLENMEKLIFPYYVTDAEPDLFGKISPKLTIIPEDVFINKFPQAFSYLYEHKALLKKRDRGNKTYESWYAFGRNQALTLVGKKLLFPYISDKPCFVFTEDRELLFYNGYAILSENTEDLLVLQKILMSSIFWYYIKNTSKPYSGTFFSTAKNYVKKFGVCDLDTKERKKLLGLSDPLSIDSFLKRKYKINFQ